MRLVLAATWAVMVCAPVCADDAPPPSVNTVNLENTWWDVARMIGAGTPWSECAARLESDLAAGADAKFGPRCASLLASVRLNLSADAGSAGPPAADAMAVALAAFPEARLNPAILLRPLQFVQPEGRLAWDVFTERAIPGPSAAPYVVYAQGREAIPALMDALGDLRATRTTASDRTRFTEPLVVRVADISLALIEAISLCRLNLEPYGYNLQDRDSALFSEWSDARRAEQRALVRDWWNGTRNLPQVEAIRWHLEHAERTQQLETINVLIGLDRGSVALPFLQPRYRNGRLLDYELAQRMLRCGAREPLDFVQEVLRSDDRVQEEMVRLIAEFGEIDDFKLLRDALIKPCAGAQPLNVEMVVNQMLTTDRVLTIPVLVAAIERGEDSTTGDPAEPGGAGVVVAGHLLRAGERIQLLSGKEFGFGVNRSPEMLKRSLEDILRWWDREGKSAYDYDQSRPLAPGGIR